MKNNLFFFSVLLLNVSMLFSQQNIWEPVGNRLDGKVFTAFAIDQNKNLYVGTLNGLYRSTNSGDSWEFIYNGLQGRDVYSIVFNDTGDIFVGTYGGGGGIFKSTDEGETWIRLNDSLINFSIRKLDINSEGHLFAAIYDHGIYRSTNNGETWEEMNDGLTQYSFQQMYIPQNGPAKDYIYISLGEIYNYNIIFCSKDNGESWEQMNFFSDTQWIVTFISSLSGDIYLGTQEQWHGGFGGIFRSTDLGMNWISLRSSNVSFLLIDNNDFVYAITGGVIRSRNSGIDWESFNEGLPVGNGGILVINPSGKLFLTIDFEGIYKTIESTTDINESEEVIPSKFALYQNYPNPFNPSTTIRYQIPQSGNVTLKVYDLLGKEIATLVDEEIVAGSYEVTFNSSELTSGVYFYSLKAVDGQATKKMIIIK